MITLLGTNFGRTRPSVLIGSNACLITWFVSTELICAVPPGQGTNSISLNSGGLVATSETSFVYAAPFIANVTYIGRPPTLGLDFVITINGDSFGLLDARVTVAGKSCPLVNQTHQRLTCLLPPGQGAQQTVLVYVSGVASNIYTEFNYAPPSILSGMMTFVFSCV